MPYVKNGKEIKKSLKIDKNGVAEIPEGVTEIRGTLGKKENGLWRYPANGGTIIEYPAENAFYARNRTLEQVSFPESLKTIGEYSFYRSNITSIKLPETITEIKDGAFMDCKELYSVEIPKSVVRIGNLAFKGCSNLKELNIAFSPDLSIGTFALEDCTKLDKDLVEEILYYSNELSMYGYKELGDTHSLKNEYEKALRAYAKAIDLFEKKKEVRKSEGYVVIVPGPVSKEEEEKAKKINTARTYNNRAYVHLMQDNCDLAISDINKAVSIIKNDISYELLGRVRLKQKNYDMAIDEFSQAIKIVEDRAIHAELAEKYIAQGKSSMADYEILKLKENSLLSANNKYIYSSEYEHKISLGRIGLYLMRGNSYLRTEKYNLAIDDFSKAMEENPSFLCYQKRAEAYNKIGKTDLAIADITRAIELEPSAENYTIRGDIYRKIGKNELASKDYDKAIELDNKYEAAYSGRDALEKGINESEEDMNSAKTEINTQSSNKSVETYAEIIESAKDSGVLDKKAVDAWHRENPQKYAFSVPEWVNIIEKDAFKDAGWLKQVKVGEGVCMIESNAFCNCKNLRTVNCVLAKSLDTVCKGAFAGCHDIDFKLPKNHNIDIEDGAFTDNKDDRQRIDFYDLSAAAPIYTSYQDADNTHNKENVM